MNPLELPFDTDDMLKGLAPWIECESPTWDAVAVNRIWCGSSDITEQ